MPEEFIQVKNALLRFFTDQQISQAARLIGFFVALFTLLQVVQNVNSGPLSQVFSSMASTLALNELPLILVEAFRFFVLFVSTAILMIFILRSIFRLAIFANLASRLINIVEENLPERENVSIYRQLHDEAVHVLRDDNINVYFRFPLNWFFTVDSSKRKWKAWMVYILLSVLSTSLLMLLLW